MTLLRHVLCATALLCASLSLARAQDDELARQPIRLIVPFSAGSGTDVTARQMTQAVGAATGWRFVVDNKAGGNGLIAVSDLMRAAPDGRTLILTGNTTHAANPALMKQLPYDPLGDFAPILRTGVVPLVLLAAPKHGFKTLDDLVRAAKAAPGKLTFGTGSASHRLAAEMLKARAGIEVAHAPYRGSAQAMTDLLGGHIDFMFVDTAAAIAFGNSDTLKVLAVTSPRRVAAFPDVPTVAEQGLAGFQVSAWSALFAPKGTPAAIVLRVNKAFIDYLQSPEGVKFIDGLGGYFEPLTPAQTADWVRSEMETYVRVFREAGVEQQ